MASTDLWFCILVFTKSIGNTAAAPEAKTKTTKHYSLIHCVMGIHFKNLPPKNKLTHFQIDKTKGSEKCHIIQTAYFFVQEIKHTSKLNYHMKMNFDEWIIHIQTSFLNCSYLNSSVETLSRSWTGSFIFSLNSLLHNLLLWIGEGVLFQKGYCCVNISLGR